MRPRSLAPCLGSLLLLSSCGGPSVVAAGADAGAAGGSDAGATTARPTEVVFEPVALPDTGPIRLWGFATAAIDASHAILFGGTTADALSGTALDRAWWIEVGDGGITARELATDATRPAPRYCGCAAWDPARRRLVVAGGRALEDPLALPPETWELDVDAPAWSRVEVPESPPGVIGCAMGWSAERDAIYLFGGGGAGGYDARVWRYDPETPAWVALDATGPTPRYDAAFEPLRDGRTLLMFGGSLGAVGAAFYSDVWLFDTTTERWRELEVGGDAPRGRRTPWTVVSEDGGGVWVSMGFDGEMRAIRDLFWLDLERARWTEIALPADGPGARAFSRALPGGPGALGTMWSGYDGARPVREVWRLRLAAPPS